MNDGDLLKLVTLATADEDETGATTHGFKVTARGEIDISSAPQLTARLDDLIEQGATVIVLDASDVEFMDSSGLRAVIGAGNKLDERGGRLFVEGMSGAVQQVLEISGVIERYRR